MKMKGVRRPTLNKIPGAVMPIARETHTKDLGKLSRFELLEIKERQQMLLTDITRLEKLPDKGERIRRYYDRVLVELERRVNVDEAAALLRALDITQTRVLTEVEWNGRTNGGLLAAVDPSDDVLDSDDEAEVDPLRIVAQGTMHERQVRELPPEESLITVEDLAEIKSFHADSLVSAETTANAKNNVAVAGLNAELVKIEAVEKVFSLKPKLNEMTAQPTATGDESRSTTSDGQDIDEHVLYLVAKTETHPPAQRESFKPFKTTISNVHDPAKELLRKRHKNWEITAATPPPIQHCGAKMLSLLDSVEIQTNYLAKMKELQEQQAMQRLKARNERLGLAKLELPDANVLKTKPSFTKYRSETNQIEGTQRFNEEDEVHDPLDEDKPGGVVTYTVFSE